MQRALTSVARNTLARSVRFSSTPAPAWAKPAFVQIYKSNLDTMQYPEKAVGGEDLVFSKLMYQLAKSEGKEDKYLADVQKLIANQASYPKTWRNTSNIAEDKLFQDLEPGVRFTLRWMQASNQMDRLEACIKIFAIYVKAAKKTMVVPITLAGLPATQAKQVEAAKAAAQATLASQFPAKKDWKLEFEYLVDPGILDGWRLEIGSLVVEDMRAYLAAAEKATGAAAVVDFTAGPSAKALPTEWALNAGTEMVSDWCDELSLFDAEEAKYGA